ncbi:hypothetical protein [Hoyosella altamirensis]|uniref:Major tail protein n=1 Tax=Hoyosella altamirensis TaxID=616997 RepID=A0A839RV68_9ACTN|nr:hypothetical protein [Hoyosella altamirensis]MBB3040128.1 hypothetical protein [Hoyosella altamirensis]
MAGAKFPVVKGIRMRVTKTNFCGLPLEGPGNYTVTDGWISASLSPNMKAAEELEQTNAEGRVCVADRTPPERKWWDATLTLCNVDTCLIGMITDWPMIVDSEGNVIGFGDQSEVPTDTAVMIEIWAGASQASDCEAPENDDIFDAGSEITGRQFGYFAFLLKEATLGDFEIGAQVSTFTLTGITGSFAQWGRSPFNPIDIDGSGTPGRYLEEPDPDQHIWVQRTPISPPDVTDGCCYLAVQSVTTPYFGETAVAVAGDQPDCDFEPEPEP